MMVMIIAVFHYTFRQNQKFLYFWELLFHLSSIFSLSLQRSSHKSAIIKKNLIISSNNSILMSAKS